MRSLTGFVAVALVFVIAGSVWAAGPRGGGPRPSAPRPQAGPNMNARPSLPAGQSGIAERRDFSNLSDRQGPAATARSGEMWQQYMSNPAHQPFSPAWYAQHPNAWHVTHPHADVAVAATAAALTGWLAWPVVASGSATYVATDTATNEVPAETPMAAATAPSPDSSEWMLLGKYLLGPRGAESPSRALELAVARDGTLRGTCCDMLSEAVQDVQGRVTQSDRSATWTVGKASFKASLDELTKPQADVTVRSPDGRTSTWQAVRLPAN